MLWVILAALLVLTLIALLVVFGRQSADLGAVSARWIAEHRVDAA